MKLNYFHSLPLPAATALQYSPALCVAGIGYLTAWLTDCLTGWLDGQLNAPAIKRYKIYHQIKNRLVPRENVNFSLFNSYTHLIVVLVRLIAFNAAFTLLIALVIVGILYLYKRSIFMIFKIAADTRREKSAIGAAHSFSDFV